VRRRPSSSARTGRGSHDGPRPDAAAQGRRPPRLLRRPEPPRHRSELVANECEDAWNVTFDERGGVGSRLGYIKDNATAFSGGLVKNQYWSSLLGQKISQAGASLYLGTTNTVRKTFTTSELATFAETNSLVVACHPTDGLFTSPDGITWTAVADPDAPKGTCVAVWQNKVYVGQTNGKVSWSAAGDATNWVATDFNKLWEKDQQAIVACTSAPARTSRAGRACSLQAGVDLPDQRLHHGRLHDRRRDRRRRRAARRRRCRLEGDLRSASAASSGGAKTRPAWSTRPTGCSRSGRDQTNLAQLAIWCAGRKGNRAVFSLTRAGSTANDLALEYHTEQNWIAPRSDAMSLLRDVDGRRRDLVRRLADRQRAVLPARQRRQRRRGRDQLAVPDPVDRAERRLRGVGLAGPHPRPRRRDDHVRTDYASAGGDSSRST
jgi:hypothetical protein